MWTADEALTLEVVGKMVALDMLRLGFWKLRAPEKWRCSASGVNTETASAASADLRAGLGLNDLGLDQPVALAELIHHPSFNHPAKDGIAAIQFGQVVEAM